MPSHIAPGKDVAYKIIVTNTSQADAYRVTVRNPIPAGVVSVGGKTDPKPDKAEGTSSALSMTKPERPAAAAERPAAAAERPAAVPERPAAATPLPKELTWHIGTLRAGERKEIDLILNTSPDAKEISNKAFVSFEHGQAVLTRVDKPKLVVRKAAPKQAAQTDPLVVKVEITNTSRVSVSDVKLVEDVSKGFEFASDPDSDAGVSPQQRIWKIGTLRAGEKRDVQYRLTAKEAGDLYATSKVTSAEVAEVDLAESTTKVLKGDMTLEFEGPPKASAGEPAPYAIKITNTGTLPLAEIRIAAAVPEDCTVTKMTTGGRRFRDQLVWDIPDREGGPLKPGQSYMVRFGLKTNTPGTRTVRATADAGRGLERSREVVTTFQGAAALQWTASVDPVSLTVGGKGTLTVRVTNQGTEVAKDVRLQVELPPQIRVDKAVPANRDLKGGVAFDALVLSPGKSETYSLSYTAEAAGQAFFQMSLSAESLGERPLTKKQAVEIGAGR
ncbi:outer membrane protein [Fimbriiglobus ruber]|uniref:Outer membrane protein n=1 Tax=Fimbriiglobus ruber TaxID=1908690 RepID=A0A225DPN4_9BACT|nr:outer membrane protein [Fimbriiglobus ruber]